MLAVEVECSSWKQAATLPFENLWWVFRNYQFPSLPREEFDIAMADYLAANGYSMLAKRALTSEELRPDAALAWQFTLKIAASGNSGRATQANDFFDRLRELKRLLEELSEDIRKKNERPTAEIRSARAFIDAFLAILDEHEHIPPQTVPSEISSGLLARLKRVDWNTFSSTTQKLVDAITKILGSF